MGRQRREFTPEYKDEAVKLVINTGRPVAVIARELGVKEQTLGRWVTLFKSRQDAGDGALSETEPGRARAAAQGELGAEDGSGVLEKSLPLPRPGSIGYEREAFALMHAENHTVSRISRLLEVSRSGFYAWSKRLPSQRAVRAEKIEAKIAWFHGESDEVSGAPRILADLREDGEVISRKTVAKAMRKLGLRGICPRQWRTTTQRDDGDTYPGDATKRQWDTGVLNAVWVGEITYLRTWEGWLYLATVIDAHSRRVIGWAIEDHMRTDLVEEALKMAIILRGELPAQVVFQTDRGTQASAQITTFAVENGITRSMGNTGICWDNAMTESFFATLKTEFYYRRVWPTQAGASRAVGAWIEERYNRRRRHSSMGQISPVAFEMHHSNQTAAARQAA